ncbi:MAG: HEPN domain-containing protein [Candidatus Eremiobacteraeota bacterium]|nr:HEPN domain-containing protein [Candidatus Eremiobacteraeota bacterium]
MKNEIREMVLYRIERAKDAKEEVKALVNVKKYSAAISRIYYGMFYIASALCLCDEFSTSKHGKLIGYFNKNYVITGIVERELGRVFSKKHLI